MKKIFFSLFFLTTFLFLARDARASLVLIKNDGTVQMKVLSLKDGIALGVEEPDEFRITEVGTSETEEGREVSLKKEDGKTLLAVGTGGTDLDVTNWEDSLVEIEERADTKKIEIKIIDGRFGIEEEGILALTDLPINIDPTKNEITLKTSSGSIFLSIFPMEAAKSALRSRFISKLAEGGIEISEKEVGSLTYDVKGERTINLIPFIKYNVPVTAHVSVSTGEIVSIDQPTWLRVFSFLFS